MRVRANSCNNRRVAKMVDGFITERLIYKDQLAPIAKLDADGNVLEEYIYGTGINSPDYILKDGTKYRIIKDHLGSVRMIDNASTGEIVKEIEYDEFGNIITETGTYSIPFGYAGGLQDRDTGLIHFGARWYDPEVGRWISKEPLGFEGAMNFYSYCDGDPVNFVDVNGLKPQFTLNYSVKGILSYWFSDFIDLSKVVVVVEDEIPGNYAAFSWGYELHIKKEYYSQNTPGGIALIAHELMHSVQALYEPNLRKNWRKEKKRKKYREISYEKQALTIEAEVFNYLNENWDVFEMWEDLEFSLYSDNPIISDFNSSPNYPMKATNSYYFERKSPW